MIDGSGVSGKDNEFSVFVGYPGIDVHSGRSRELRSSIWHGDRDWESYSCIDYN